MSSTFSLTVGKYTCPTANHRLVKVLRNLGSGEDDEPKTAYAHFHKMVEQEAGAVRNAILAGVEQVKVIITEMLSDLEQGLATLQVQNLATLKINDLNTKRLMTTTESMDHHLRREM